MPAPHPVEFRQRAVELARMCEKPPAEMSEDLACWDLAELALGDSLAAKHFGLMSVQPNDPAREAASTYLRTFGR